MYRPQALNVDEERGKRNYSIINKKFPFVKSLSDLKPIQQNFFASNLQIGRIRQRNLNILKQNTEKCKVLFASQNLLWRYDTQHNETQHNGIHHNDTQHNEFSLMVKNVRLSITTLSIMAEHCYAECHLC